MGLGARLFEFRRHQDPHVAYDSKLKFDSTVVLYAKYVVDTNESQTLPCICVSYYFRSDGGPGMVEAVLEEAQEDIIEYNPRSRVRSHFGR